MNSPGGIFPADLSLLTDNQVHQWQMHWHYLMDQTIEPDKKHIYQHNWKRCRDYLSRLADQKLESQMNMENRQ